MEKTGLAKSEILVLVAAAVILLSGISSRPLFNFDEALYAEASREMLASGNYLSPTWNGEGFFHKPPLLLWITSIWYFIFGVSEFSARLTSALAGIASSVLTYKMGRRSFGAFVGFAGCAILLSSGLFVAESTYGRSDALLLAFSLLAFYSYLEAAKDARWWYGVAAGLAFAAMTKGVAAGVPFAVIVGAILLDRRRVDCRRVLQGLLAFGSLVVVWHGYMIWAHGRAFVDEYFLHQVIARSSGRIEGMASGSGYYFRVLGQYFFPWCYLAPFALALAIWKRGTSFLLLVCVVLVFGLFTFAGTKLSSYILPLIPALALLTARLFALIRPLFAIPALALLAFLAIPSIVKVRTPHADFASVKRLSLAASRDTGSLLTAPGLYCAPEIRFYSGRRVCARDERGNTIALLTDCEPNEPRHVLLRESGWSEIGRQYDVQEIEKNGAFVYAAIFARADLNENFSTK